MSIEQYLVPVKPRKRVQKTNICADCQCNIACCPWLRRNKPVQGWTAELVQLRLRWGECKTEVVLTWHITGCPLYIPPPPERTEEQGGADMPYWMHKTV